MPKNLHYPNGRPVPSGDIWDIVEQLAMCLAKSFLHQREAKEKGREGDFGLSPDQMKQSHSHMYRLAAFLADAHPAELIDQSVAIYTDEEKKKSFFLVRGDDGAYVITSSTIARASSDDPISLFSVHVVIYPEILDAANDLEQLILRN